MKAALNAPSAKMARKWLGSRKATKKASATGPAPRIAASMISRAKPVTRETSVKPPTVRMRSIIAATILPARGRKLLASPGQRAANGGDGTALHRFLEVSVHGEADDFLGQSLAHGRAAVGYREVPIGRLPVHRLGVVDRRRNALGFERSRERAAPS